MTFYDANGNATAYLDNDGKTLFLWNGKPVAYLYSDNVFGFNGKHLGWLEGGIIWDHGGQKCGFTKQQLKRFPRFEPFKAFKQFKPFKSFRQFAPFKPFKKTSISATNLHDFLESGRS